MLHPPGIQPDIVPPDPIRWTQDGASCYELNRQSGDSVLLLTERSEKVTVVTVSTLRALLKSLASPSCTLSVHKVHRDRVSIRADYTMENRRSHSELLLPAYPTGCPADAPANNLNVVLDPLGFVDADSHEQRHVFVPLLGHELLEHYEKMHPQDGLTVSRCC
jgi:hypothetical protein